VGFRPFVANLARDLGLTGWVGNNHEGVVVEVQGEPHLLDAFLDLVQKNKPDMAWIDKVSVTSLPLADHRRFMIRESSAAQPPDTIVLPDLATCDECLRDVMTPGNRRYRYPFTNCTRCGPRFSLIETLPYDRGNTTMKGFAMCSECHKEYCDPHDRRFHAQPNACPECGPQLSLWNLRGEALAEQDEALAGACQVVRQGAILALKGIGGFHLIAREESLPLLRERKRRPDKPFAAMYPSLKRIKQGGPVSKMEEELLLSPQAPIVLLRSRPCRGVMLPYSPLHHLLLSDLNIPLIATSGNRADEPICIDEHEALSELKGIADYFLVHNRPICRPVDDSLVHVAAGRRQILRRARGYSSIPIQIDFPLPPAIAVGAHQKNTVAVSAGHKIHISQHLGDLDTEKACNHYVREARALLDFYGIDPEHVVADCHPAYRSTQFAAQFQKPTASCQHHVAHIYSCMAEHGLTPPLLGVSWDGTGYGLDKTIWGGEFFLIHADYSPERIARFRPFPLPCGKKAVQEPRLSALGILYAIFDDELWNQTEAPFSENERRNLIRILSTRFQTHECSSAGRLFDAVSSLINLRHISTFEGQAAMELEALAETFETDAAYDFTTDRSIDWEPMVRQILKEESPRAAAAKFHNTLSEIILDVARQSKQKKVVLSGGVFQNRMLTEKAVQMLKAAGFCPYWNENIPPNDGGISLGQLVSLRRTSCV